MDLTFLTWAVASSFIAGMLCGVWARIAGR